jgi:hypothetical protein
LPPTSSKAWLGTVKAESSISPKSIILAGRQKRSRKPVRGFAVLTVHTTGQPTKKRQMRVVGGAHKTQSGLSTSAMIELQEQPKVLVY